MYKAGTEISEGLEGQRDQTGDWQYWSVAGNTVRSSSLHYLDCEGLGRVWRVRRDCKPGKDLSKIG